MASAKSMPAVFLHLYFWEPSLQVARAVPMRGRASAVEQTCFGQDKGAGAGRGDPSASLRGLAQEFDQARRRRFGATAEKQRIENRGAERLCHDADADRAAHEAAGLGQQTNVVDRLAHLLVRVFKDGERSEAHHLKAGAEDKTDTPHGRLCTSVQKRRLNDL